MVDAYQSSHEHKAKEIKKRRLIYSLIVEAEHLHPGVSVRRHHRLLAVS